MSRTYSTRRRRRPIGLLAGEGLAWRSVFSGDVNFDALLQHVELARLKSTIVETLGLRGGHYAVLSVHRSENTDAGRLMSLLECLGTVTGPDLEVVFPIHPRTVPLLPVPPERFDLIPGIRVIRPLRFLDMLRLIDRSAMVLTDSGGLQKEAFFLDRPCITLRDETEWTETVELGGNVLTGMSPTAVIAAVRGWQDAARARGGVHDFSSRAAAAFGDGSAAEFIVQHLFELVGQRKSAC